jgi:hypothetical protein
MFNQIRRALRVLDVFSLSTLNPPKPSDSAYTTQMGHAFSQTRIF